MIASEAALRLAELTQKVLIVWKTLKMNRQSDWVNEHWPMSTGRWALSNEHWPMSTVEWQLP